MSFPDGFLWGAATAAHQVEGGNVNNDSWLLEHAPGSHFAEPSGDACDHYHRYRDDIALARRARTSAPTGSRSSGRASSPRRASSRAPPSTTTGACSRACHEDGLTPDRHVPPLHLPALDRSRGRLGGGADGVSASPASANAPCGTSATSCRRRARSTSRTWAGCCTRSSGSRTRAAARAGGGLRRRSGRRPSGSRVSSTLRAAKATEVMLSAHRRAVDAIKGVRAETQAGVTLAITEWQVEPGGEEALQRLRRTSEDDFLEGVEATTSSACRTTP